MAKRHNITAVLPMRKVKQLQSELSKVRAVTWFLQSKQAELSVHIAMTSTKMSSSSYEHQHKACKDEPLHKPSCHTPTATLKSPQPVTGDEDLYGDDDLKFCVC